MTQNLFVKSPVKKRNFAESSTFFLIESIKSFIFENDCPSLTRDISHLNIIDASRIVGICSAFHYAKYPHGEMNWIVNSSEVQHLTKPLSLGNVNFTTLQ